MFRLIFLFFMSVMPHSASMASDVELSEVVDGDDGDELFTPQQAVDGCLDEYCCMVARVSKDAVVACGHRTLECGESSYACCADALFPWRYQDKQARTECIRSGLDDLSCCCGITCGVCTVVGGFITGLASLIEGTGGTVATIACGATACFSCCAVGSRCVQPDSLCPVAYCCEKCFHTEKFECFSNNSKRRNPLDVTDENKAK